ncbi:MAG: T9SS type A sorting domain-containing protein, partial [Bacteroidales bacterium]|nr:T9SS type A sorting domain-containing protein [Bacteroidales bacterium]
TESGEYYQTFTAANSSDSIVRLELVVIPVPEPEISIEGVLDTCHPETASVTLLAGEFQSYLWSNGETTSSIIVTAPDDYYVEVVDEHGCHGVSEMAHVVYSSVLTEAPQISLVGMSRNETNRIMWNMASTAGVAGYEIYREDSESDVYTCIKRIENPNTHTYVDQTSEPSSRAYRYKICAFDECNGKSPMSEVHKTMHLTINRGVGTNWNLTWSHYEGLAFSAYKIYRGTSSRDMVVIGEIPSTLNSFTDIWNTMEEGMYYRVEVVTNSSAKNEEISLSSNIVANEYVERYTVTAISSNYSMGTVHGGGTYPAELDITLAAIPNEGYEFVSWNDGNTENPRVIAVTENAAYIASFAEIPPAGTYMLTAIPANPEHGTVTGGGLFLEGEVITIEAVANEGYRFLSWSDENTDNPREITVTENAVYVAYFTEIPPVNTYTITAVPANQAQGTVTGGGTYPVGTVVTLTAEANDGYLFIQWSDDNTDNPREITVTEDAIFIASFAPATGIDESTFSEISVYPNPVTDILNITSSKDISEIEIVNVMGQVVYRTEVNGEKAVCDVEGLTTGVYFVKIYGNPCTSTGSVSGIVQKFIKE